ncbi:hypothetical protein AB0N77_09665 [Streptomyces misionensis]|uniref:hypothetical protein n=1 Tax=Streptomyces misionensis TaxID=67331 RepID=UPI00341A6A17
MTPADELRAAAEKLRALASAVSAPDPALQPFHAEGCDVTQGRTPGLYDVATTQTPELAAYIAAMHPGVGLALAKVFDAWARMASYDSTLLHRVGGDETLAVARAINGSTA